MPSEWVDFLFRNSDRSVLCHLISRPARDPRREERKLFPSQQYSRGISQLVATYLHLEPFLLSSLLSQKRRCPFSHMTPSVLCQDFLMLFLLPSILFSIHFLSSSTPRRILNHRIPGLPPHIILLLCMVSYPSHSSQLCLCSHVLANIFSVSSTIVETLYERGPSFMLL